MAIILKTSPEENLYVVWNMTADGHEFIGTNDELEDYLKFYRPTQAEDFEDLLEYINSTGTSADDSSYGGWEDTGFIVQSNYYPESFPATAFRWINRENIGRHVKALEEQKWEEAYSLTEPCND